MKNRKSLIITGAILFIMGISICFGTAIILSNKDTHVIIERAGMCNPLKPQEDKTLSIDEDTKNKIKRYWQKTNKKKSPEAHELCGCVINEYKIIINDEEFFYNLDIGYVYYNNKEIDIDEEFSKYLSKVIKENDGLLESN